MRRRTASGSSEKQFELSGSIAHYPPSISFKIEKMKLQVEPDLEKHMVSCSQELEIRAINDIDSIQLDAVELKITSIINKESQVKLDYDTSQDKLNIKLGRELKEQETLAILISYTAEPKKGFYFITPDKDYPHKRYEAWTQGQSTEARHWYPSLDHPQARFPTEIFVTVPSGYKVISNGVLNGREWRADGKETFHWSEPIPHPAYLTSIVIGKYADAKIDNLYYYVPEDRKEDVERSFGRTMKIKRFIESYLETPYPYVKYSQVTVQDFVAQGMENASCTTLTVDTLHDEKAHLDFTSDKLVAHELAHQWFGDLVTCRDWQHIWLNEGFATYFEALYWQHAYGYDEFQYFVLQIAYGYFDEVSNRYCRPIVTKVYKHPDNLFDAHSYEKGACVVHMLKIHIGENYFRRSLNKYLQRFYNKAVETDDLRKIFEEESGKSLQQFFDQWIYRKGHPVLRVEFSAVKNIAKIKIEQIQDGELFEFPLDLKLVFRDGSEKIESLNVKDREKIFCFTIDDRQLDWFSIDPELKILKTVAFKVSKQMLMSQLKKGKTIVERIEAAQALKHYAANDVADSLKETILTDHFWGVAVEAAKTLGSLRTARSFDALKMCLAQVNEPKTRIAIVAALGGFRKKELLELLTPVLWNDKSYFVQSQAAAAIGKTRQKKAIPLLKEAANTSTFLDVVSQGAIAGLKEFAGDKEIAGLLVEKSSRGNHNKVREAATLALAKFVDGNPLVFDQLKKLLNDKWFKVRANACRAFADAQSRKAIPYLISVSENDIDAGVRRTAEESVATIRAGRVSARRIAEREYEKVELVFTIDRHDT